MSWVAKSSFLTNATLDELLLHGVKLKNNDKNSRLLVESKREFSVVMNVLLF